MSEPSRYHGWAARLMRAVRWLAPTRTAARRSVRGKLMAVVVQTTAIALLLAAVAMSVEDLTAYRSARVAQLSTEASILALAVTPALAFDDHAAAQRSLATLQAHTAVVAAGLYDTRGRLYAQYVHPAETPPPAQLQAVGAVQLLGERAVVLQRVTQNGEWLGTIYLRAHFDMTGRLLSYLEIILWVTALGVVLALILSTALQRAITTPLDAMAAVARQLVTGRDYSLRATKSSDDEIGLFVEAFNRMLDEVELRTRALEQSNAALQSEVRSRESAEEALRDADRRKDEFLATLAHELRNPLAPIRHAAELLELPAADDRQRQWTREVITRQVKRMGLLLDDLLDVSRITRGRLQLRKERVTLSAVVATAIETAQPLIEAKQHRLQISVPTQPVELEADPLRLSQAISNLLHNAAKYTDAHGVIQLNATLSGAELRIEVADNGIGFDPGLQSRLFEMFSQVESPVDRADGGLGIGLALVKGLVALHGGTVEAFSAGPGHGSTFTIRLTGARNVTLPGRGGEPPGLQAPAHSKIAAPRCRVLVADDNQDSAESLMMVLETWGYTVSTAHSGTEALQVALRERPELFVLDIGMPGISGYEVASSIRSQPWGAGVLLLALTGWGQVDDVQRAKAAGFDAHMTKPVDLERMQALLAQYRATLLRPEAGRLG